VRKPTTEVIAAAVGVTVVVDGGTAITVIGRGKQKLNAASRLLDRLASFYVLGKATVPESVLHMLDKCQRNGRVQLVSRYRGRMKVRYGVSWKSLLSESRHHN
jgi:hypothetical protein